jgi:hypothetical protein
LGDPSFGDRLEKVIFNALPATFSPDMWAHQYDQQVNQAECSILPDRPWNTNGADANIFGLEPNYGCCTANLSQGWPKFAAHLWMRTQDGGLAAVAYAPSRVEIEVDGAPVTVSLDTDYPFRETLAISVEAERAVSFPLVLRVPAWAEGATLRVGNLPERRIVPGSLHRIEREWRGKVDIALRFPMKAKAATRHNEAIAVERGPLVYSLKIDETWTRVNADKPHRELPHGDFEVRPTTPWNYGLVLDPVRPDVSLRFEERPVGERPFSPEGAGMSAVAKARRLPRWALAHGWAGELSLADTSWAHAVPKEPDGPLEEVRLVPYGCTNIRITEFPALDE